MENFSFTHLFQTMPGDVTHHTLAVGDILFHEGDPAHAVYAIQSGRINLVHYTQQGTLVTHYSVQAGELIAEGALFKTHYFGTAIAQHPCQLIALPKQSFLALLRQYPDLTLSYIAQLINRLHESKILLALRNINSAHERLLNYLRLLAHPDHQTIVLEQSFKTIAENLCLSPEVVSRSLKQLQEDGIISRIKNRITFLE